MPRGAIPELWKMLIVVHWVAKNLRTNQTLVPQTVVDYLCTMLTNVTPKPCMWDKNDQTLDKANFEIPNEIRKLLSPSETAPSATMSAHVAEKIRDLFFTTLKASPSNTATSAIASNTRSSSSSATAAPSPIRDTGAETAAEMPLPGKSLPATRQNVSGDRSLARSL